MMTRHLSIVIILLLRLARRKSLERLPLKGDSLTRCKMINVKSTTSFNLTASNTLGQLRNDELSLDKTIVEKKLSPVKVQRFGLQSGHQNYFNRASFVK